jgi:hypothetical protein
MGVHKGKGDDGGASQHDAVRQKGHARMCCGVAGGVVLSVDGVLGQGDMKPDQRRRHTQPLERRVGCAVPSLQDDIITEADAMGAVNRLRGALEVPCRCKVVAKARGRPGERRAEKG